ncbi:M28 family peptidase [Pontibacter sp. SGAir0037]|uniref:M28 family peptidase n=1 Tax=Pontibacter sp. SGAir0037 TaxID=2571030 RepID=UPI0010CCD3B5|nr:M28 family peptidase [Pontibacter sp. SGAir0037]QCR24427.1 glutamine cyclotransferase [Pontibacter sp. SGAir0037]
MKNRLNTLAVLLFFTVILYRCDSSERGSNGQATVEVEKPVVEAPAFNADSAYQFVEKQVAFGPRVPNTAEHYATGDWLISQLRSYGLEVQVQSFQMRAFNGTMLNLRNIIASYNPKAANRVLLAAHWDTRPFADKAETDQDKPIDGANDGGSGVGILLEVARAMHAAELKPNVGVDIILFDGEDYGQPDNSEFPYQDNTWCLGAQYWSKNKHVPNYRAKYGILLDMVGAEGAKFAREGASMNYAKEVVDKVWRAGNNLGFSEYFIYENAPAITDDHVYVNEWGGVRMIDIIEYNLVSSDGDYFGDYHHRHTDNMDVISRNTLKAVGQTVLHVIYNE